MKMTNTSRKYILVPVDFTPESVHALRYAKIIAEQLQLAITVTHIRPLEWENSQEFQDSMESSLILEKVEKVIVKAGLETQNTKKTTQVEIHIESGHVKTQIMALASKEKYSLIILSTTAEHTLSRQLKMPISSFIGIHSNKPVIVVPIGALLRRPEVIVLGCAEESNQILFVETFMNIIMTLGVELKIVYVTNDYKEYDRMKNNFSEILLKLGWENANISWHRLSGEKNVENALVDFAALHRADLLALVTHNRNMLERLGHYSVTRKMLSEPVIPYFILHSVPAH